MNKHLKHINVQSIHKDLDHRMVKVKVKFTLEQAMMAQRGSRGIALLFL